jgi:hypothetical protein
VSVVVFYQTKRDIKRELAAPAYPQELGLESSRRRWKGGQIGFRVRPRHHPRLQRDTASNGECGREIVAGLKATGNPHFMQLSESPSGLTAQEGMCQGGHIPRNVKLSPATSVAAL